MTDSRETLARIRAQADAATEGPWAPWRDQDGAPHMSGLLMVGNAAAVIPEGESWVEGVDVNPIAHTYTPEDREFIAASRTTVPALLDALEKVLNLHVKAQPVPAAFGTQEGGDYCVTCAEDWPCPTAATITAALAGVEGEG
ncbi:hypothetical protein [Micrococcus luteus]|uniref:hypothetical protein n=1 Tax=Micrococcus luteus TaxID=1270 RepID=UPI0011A98608|nr:hypothetical protein [Micrococcus luteus]